MLHARRRLDRAETLSANPRSNPTPTVNTGTNKIHGYLARFDDAVGTYKAAHKVREKGYRRWDVFSPFPVHGMDAAMGLGRSKLPFLVFIGGALGCLGGFFLQVGTQIWIYPTIVQGKPSNLYTLPAFFPVIFALTILIASISVVVGFCLLGQLPRLHHPLFNSKQFHRTSDDAFFIVIEASDSRFNREQTRKFLEEIGGKDIELVEDTP